MGDNICKERVKVGKRKYFILYWICKLQVIEFYFSMHCDLLEICYIIYEYFFSPLAMLHVSVYSKSSKWLNSQHIGDLASSIMIYPHNGIPPCH